MHRNVLRDALGYVIGQRDVPVLAGLAVLQLGQPGKADIEACWELGAIVAAEVTADS
jgi:hypothetical protein